MIDLTNKTSVSIELEAIAGKLKNAGDESAADRVHQLALAVKDGLYADAWAATDVHQMINANAVIERYRTRKVTDRIIAWIEWIRNALIFAPLVVSWYYISQAVDAYSKLINDNPDQIRTPFLYLWQQGFLGRLAWWQTLSWMALIDFAILFAVLFLTVLVYTLSNVLKMRKEEDANLLSSQLTHALAGAALCLTTRKWKQPTNVLDGLKGLIDTFDVRTEALLKRIEALHGLQDMQIRTAAGFRNDLKIMFTDVKTSVDGLKGANTTLSSSVGGMSSVLNTASGKLDGLMLRADQALTLLRQEITDQEKVLKEQQNWGMNLKDALEKLGKAADAGEAIAKEQAKVASQLDAIIKDMTKQQTDYLAAATKQQNAQKDLENNVRATMIHTQEIVKELRQCAIDLRGYTRDMNDLVRRAAAMIPVH